MLMEARASTMGDIKRYWSDSCSAWVCKMILIVIAVSQMLSDMNDLWRGYDGARFHTHFSY